MAKQALGKLKPFVTIGREENKNVREAMTWPLSGYIGGDHVGGYWCQRLARDFEIAFKVDYATPCNSATSGLLAALMAADVGFGDHVWVTDYSMSATAAVAHILGAKLTFVDIDQRTFGLDPIVLEKSSGEMPRALIVTNLFGNPACLHRIRQWCYQHDVFMIEDNAQAPFAKEHGQYAGTIGHAGVFSLNIHKHIQAGEGGVVVCHNADYAANIRDAINHGELRSGGIPGLNLRMTETTAAIACAQLKKATDIIEGRREIAHALSEPLRSHGRLLTPMEDKQTKHVYYLWALRALTGAERCLAMRVFQKYKFPIRAGYAPPLHTLFPHSGNVCPVTQAVEETIMVYENCAYTPTKTQLKQMQDILKRVGDAVS